jgi:enoyl-CoA hydratase
LTENIANSGVSSSRDGAIAHLTLNRPDKLNAVNTPMLLELASRVLECDADPSVRVILLTGRGRAFCSGGDLSGRDTEGAGPAANDVVQAIVGIGTPVIAGVHGGANGFGCTLAFACDLVVAARSAYFQLAFTKVGLMPDGGATALIPAAVGRQRAARMAYLAERLPARDAFDHGLISHLVDDEVYEAELAHVVETMANGPTQSHRRIKEALRETTLPLLTSSQLREVDGQEHLARTADHQRAIKAFGERRAPHFEGT